MPVSAPDITMPGEFQSHAVADDPIVVRDLTELMASVSEVTARLQATHDALRQQVAQLQDELAAANAKLRRSQALAALGEMAAGIAHEIRNPLGSIQLYNQMLSEDVAAEPARSDLCARIDAAVVRLNAIVSDVLTFARETRIRKQRIVASDLIREAIQSCAGLLNKSGIEVETDVPAIDLCIDPGLMVQALGNLIRNAAEAMTADGVGRASPARDGAGQNSSEEAGTARPTSRPRRIDISAARETGRRTDGHRAEYLAIRVDDSGPGIPPEIMPRLFNPFFTTRREGTGLGLSIVHRIIDAHEGDLEITNRPGGGARIEIRLPFDQGQNVHSRDEEVPDIEVGFTCGPSRDEAKRSRGSSNQGRPTAGQARSRNR